MAPGEPRFFPSEGKKFDPNDLVLRNNVTDIDTYRALFDGVTKEKAIGDISPSYLSRPESAARIKHYIPDARMFAILRNPVERAYSHYLHMIKIGWEPEIDFVKAIREEEVMVGEWRRSRSYVHMGFYHEQLARYFKLFDREQLRVYFFDDLKKDNKLLIKDLYQFLGVSDDFIPDLSLKHNPSGVPKSRVLQDLLYKSHPLKSFVKTVLPKKSVHQFYRFRLGIQKHNLERPEFPTVIRKELVKLYREDILKLQDLLARDLSRWLV